LRRSSGAEMRITVKLFATFRKGRFDAEVREVPPGTTVSNVVDEMRLPGSIGIIFVNSRHADPSRVLADGDTLAIFPLVGGG
ncbi:MAG: MoaD/ThiS family protein, partial [Candidatus Deferrimicrobiaceae bacterium]